MTKTEELNTGKQKPIEITISTLANCIERDCEKGLQLYFKLPNAIDQPNELQKAFILGGHTFEKRIAALQGDALVDYTDNSPYKSKGILRNAKVGTILFQLPFRVPEKFYTQNVYRFKQFIPDFLVIKKHPKTGKRKLFIIDAKYSTGVKTTHRFQVATYAYLLQYLVKNIDDLEVDLEGAIWLPSNRTKPLSAESTEPISFRIDLMLPKVQQFYESELPAMLQKENPSWLFGHQCYTCDYQSTCRKESHGAPSAIAYLTKGELKALEKRYKHTDDIDDIEDLVTNLEELKIQATAPIPQWMKVPRFLPHFAAYETQKPQFRGIPTTSIGEGVDCDIFLSFVFDPQFRMICTYAIRAFKSDGSIVEDMDYTMVVGINRRKISDYIELAVSLVKDLTRILDEMDEEKSRCIVVVANGAIKSYLQDCLIQVASLADDDVSGARLVQARKAMRLLFTLFPNEKILAIEKVPWYSYTFEAPDTPLLVSLQELVRENIALGESGFYTFEHLLEWLCGIDDKSTFDEVGLYTWWKSDQPTASRLFDQIEKLLFILAKFRELADDFKERTGKLIYCYKTMPFRWPILKGFASNTMGRLTYFAKYDCLMECDNTRSERIRDRLQEDKHGLCLRLKKVQSGIRPRGMPYTRLFFDVILGELDNAATHQVRMDNLDIKNTDYSYLLVPDTYEGTVKAIQFPDMKLSSFWSCIDYTLTNITSLSEDRMSVELDCNRLNGIKLEIGGDYRLYSRHRDFTSQRLVEGLIYISQSGDKGVFQEIIRNPNRWAIYPYSYPKKQLELALLRREYFEMSKSQSEISANIIQKRLQIVWGPPGSGKTTFLALFINWYLTYVHTKGKRCIIGVTALTRHAIMNLLKAIKSKQKKYRAFSYDMIYMKSTMNSDNAKSELPDVWQTYSSKIHEKLEKQACPLVLGGTIWDFNKIKRKMGDDFQCDMIIIDEGSQLPVTQAGLAINCLDAQQGRLIVVGDHMQLGPILQSGYPKTEPQLYSSIQNCLMRTAENKSIQLDQFLTNRSEAFEFGPNTAQLKDNWRMNKNMNVFYHPVYGDDIVARYPDRQLQIDWTRASGSSLIADVLDPAQAITVVKIPFAEEEYDRQIEVEAEIVSEVLETYLKIAIDADKVMVVTPRHKQRAAVEHQIQLRSLDRGKAKVDTVDKMQGQEGPLVLACFTYNEITGRELDFLLDFRRWNVTVSRAKCKVVVFTTDNVLSLGTLPGLSFDLFSNVSTVEGWGFICMLKEWVERTQAVIEWAR